MTVSDLDYSTEHDKEACYSEPNILLITGGTGSLGNEVVNQIIARNNKLPPYHKHYFTKIIIYSRDEQKQADMAARLENNSYVRFFIGDVRDRSRLRLAMHGVTHVIHAAALKIVPSIEYNPQECLKTNIQGAENLIEICAGMPYPRKKVLALSTDKAVNPINLYGASKLAAEKLFLDAHNLAPNCMFSVARYGNVSNSRGSVIPLFKKQLENNIPLWITDPKMTRFWITLEDAAKFVIDRLGDMVDAEIYIPMMESYNIEDLAHVILEDKFGPDGQYPTKIIGMRPGEKLHEDLVTKYEFEYVYDMSDHDTPVYHVIKKQRHEEYAKILDEAHLSGIRVSDTYNSSMFVMDKETLRARLLEAGLIDPPFDIVEDTRIIEFPIPDYHGGHS